MDMYSLDLPPSRSFKAQNARRRCCIHPCCRCHHDDQLQAALLCQLRSASNQMLERSDLASVDALWLYPRSTINRRHHAAWTCNWVSPKNLNASLRAYSTEGLLHNFTLWSKLTSCFQAGNTTQISGVPSALPHLNRNRSDFPFLPSV